MALTTAEFKAEVIRQNSEITLTNMAISDVVRKGLPTLVASREPLIRAIANDLSILVARMDQQSKAAMDLIASEKEVSIRTILGQD